MEETIDNYRIVIEPDDVMEEPWTQMDYLGTIVLYSDDRRMRQFIYALGVKTGSASAVVSAARKKGYIVCSFDLGFNYALPEDICKAYEVPHLTEKVLKRAREVLRQEIATYKQYLEGDVWGFQIFKDDIQVDSCYGFYGFDFCDTEAKSLVTHMQHEDQHNHQDYLKRVIKSQVPLQYREPLTVTHGEKL